MQKRTESIVISNRQLNEADLIVTLLTKDHGLIDVFAKSPRKVGSRFGSSLEPLTYSKVAFIGKQQSNLPRLIQSDIIKPFSKLREEFNLFMALSEALELTKKILPQGVPQRGPFQLLLNMLISLEEGKDLKKQIIYYKIKLLKFAGFAPGLERCIRCSSPTNRFSLSEGTLLCSKCSPSSEHLIIENSIKNLYNFMLRIRPSVLDRLKITEDTLKGLERVINSHINYNIIDNKLNTHQFIASTRGVRV